MDKEKLIKSIMKDLECTREEAEEVAEMEIKAKGIKRYEKAEETKSRKPREKKVDETKKELIEYLEKALEMIVNIDNVKNESEISFTFKKELFTLKLIKHRPPKK
jgi:soluble cytochrome b562